MYKDGCAMRVFIATQTLPSRMWLHCAIILLIGLQDSPSTS